MVGQMDGMGKATMQEKAAYLTYEGGLASPEGWARDMECLT